MVFSCSTIISKYLKCAGWRFWIKKEYMLMRQEVCGKGPKAIPSAVVIWLQHISRLTAVRCRSAARGWSCYVALWTWYLLALILAFFHPLLLSGTVICCISACVFICIFFTQGGACKLNNALVSSYVSEKESSIGTEVPHLRRFDDPYCIFSTSSSRQFLQFHWIITMFTHRSWWFLLYNGGAGIGVHFDQRK